MIAWQAIPSWAGECAAPNQMPDRAKHAIMQENPSLQAAHRDALIAVNLFTFDHCK